MALRISRTVLNLVLGEPTIVSTRVPKIDALRAEWECGCFATEHNVRGNVYFLTSCATHREDFAEVEQAR